MERIKHLLFLLVFLLGVTFATNAQLMRAPGDTEIDFEQVKLTYDPVSLTNEILFTGCPIPGPVEIRVNISGETGVYLESKILNPADKGYIGKPQNVPLCFRVKYANKAGEMDILGLGANVLLNTNAATQGYPVAQREETGLFEGSAIIKIDPTMITGVGTGTYIVEAYLCSDETAYLEQSEITLTSSYGITLDMEDMNLYIGCVTPPELFTPAGTIDPNCVDEPKVVVKYIGGGTDDVDVIGLAAATPDSIILNVLNYNAADNTFSIDAAAFKAIELGCGTYTAYVAIDVAGTGVYAQASEVIDFQICAEYPYALKMEDWEIYKYEDVIGCDYNVNPAFYIFGPAGSAAEGWTADGPVQFIMWSAEENGSELFDFSGSADGKWTGFPARRSGNYNAANPGQRQSVARRNFPDVTGVGCEKFYGQLVCWGTNTVVSDSIEFTIKVNYPVVADLETIEFCVDPVCPGEVKFEFDIQNNLCRTETGMTPVIFELEYVSGAKVFGEKIIPSWETQDQTSWYWINTKEDAGGKDHITLFVKPLTAGDEGVGKYKLNILYYDTGVKVGASMDETGECPVEREIDVNITCCAFDPSQLKIEDSIVIDPNPFCPTKDELKVTLTALFKSIMYPPDNPGAEGTDPEGYSVVCPGYVRFEIRDLDTTDGLTAALDPEDGESGDLFEIVFTGYGVGTFQIVPIIVNEYCHNGAEGTPYEFTIDVRKPLSVDMLDDEVNGKLFYRTNGSDPFGPMVLTNAEEIVDGVVADIWIFDPHGLVGYKADAADPFIYDNPLNIYHSFQGVPVVDGAITMPQIFLQNGELTQEPIYVYYGLRYADGTDCCEYPEPEGANPPASARQIPTTHCASGEFYIVVKPLDDAINQDLKATPVKAAPICYDETADINAFTVDLNAFYHELEVFENMAQLPTGVEVRFRIDYVSGDEIIDLLNDQPQDAITHEVAGPVVWEPTAIKAGKGVYMVTPYFNEVMTLTNGVAVVFTLEAQTALTPDMVGLNGQTLTFTNGDIVPAISLDANLPAGAKVTWVWDDLIANNVEIGSALSGNLTIPSFTAVNNTLADTTAYYKAAITYGDDNGCPADTARWSIVVKPAIDGGQLVANDPTLLPMIICKNETGRFITPTATYKGQTAPTETTYLVEFVSGDEVAHFTPLASMFTIVTIGVGKGTYQLVPVLLGVRGVPAIFTVEVLEPVTPAMVGLNKANLIYSHGDMVDNIYLDAQLPEGATISWTLITGTFTEDNKDVTYTAIGTTTKGNRYIPAFIATNTTGKPIKAKFEFVAEYAGITCGDGKGSFTIEVLPNTIEDLNLIAGPVESETICYSVGAKFPEIEFSAEHLLYTTETVDISADVTYRVEFASGNAIIDLSKQPVKNKWTPEVIAAGTGTYRVVPIYNNGTGIPSLFTLTALEALTKELVGVNGATFNYQNGDVVPAISLDANLPAGAKVTWTIDNNNIGLNSTSGNAVIPSFVATNTGLIELSATVKFTVAYPGANSCSEEGTFTINVAPNTIEDYDLVMNPVANEQRICNDPDGAFEPIAFSSERTDGADFTAGDVRYVVSYVGGTNVLDLANGNEESALAGTTASWLPSMAYDRFGDLIAGTGTYRVTPYWNNGQGVPVLFTLTVYPKLDNNQIDIQDALGNPVEFVYYNGDVVPEFNFLGTKVPAGVTIAWELKKDQPNVGSTTSGVGRMPAFIAVNKTNAPVTAEYIAWLKYEECSTKDEAVNFFITVNPKVLTDTDLYIAKLDSQRICFGETFKNVELLLKHRFEEITLPFTYEYQLVDGDNVLGSVEGVLDADCNPYLWKLSDFTGGVIGTGVYSITPIMGNYAGRPIEITLTRLPAPTVNQVADIELCSGSPLNVVFTSELDGTKYDWTAEENKVGIPTTGKEAINILKVTNITEEPVKVKITVTPRVQGTLCGGTTMEFYVTVNPKPTINEVPNYAYVEGTKVGKDEVHKIEFTGIADKYKWSSSNPTIYEGLDPYQYDEENKPPQGEVGYTYGTIKAADDGKFYMPDFTTANYTKEIVTSTITVTPMYGECEGEPIQFHILVKSETAGIILESVKNVVLCEGEETDPISFGLPLETFYYVTWKSDKNIGLEDQPETASTRAKNIPSFVALTVDGKQTVATVTVTPHVRYNSVEFKGTELKIKFTVNPRFDLTANISDEVKVTNFEFSACQGTDNDVKDIELDAFEGGTIPADDTIYAYQWYKDGVLLPGATARHYKRLAASITLSDAGEYYCMISSKNGCANKNGVTSVRSKIFKVVITEVSGDVLVEQLWNDVLQVNCIPSENGGRSYIAFAWFKEGGTAIGDGKSWVQVPDTNAKYYVEASTASGVYTSCPISLITTSKVAPVTVYVAPSPVASGSSADVTVTGITEGTIQIVNLSGSVVSTTQMSGEITPVNMPGTSGNYVVKVIPANGGETAETKVIVK